MAYRVHELKIRRGDRDKGDAILLEHWNLGDLDDFDVHVTAVDDAVTYRIRPFVYEDFETIKREFVQNGIALL